MSIKTSADVLIGGKIYTLSGYESEEYLHRIASYINNKMSEFNQLEEYRHFPADMKAALLQLNIADDYFKAKSRVENLEQDMAAGEKEIYDLKHGLIALQIKLDTLEEEKRAWEEAQRKHSEE